MREFFRPWRRKIGVLTLLMACVFAAGWVRSFVMADTLSIVANKSSYGLWSTNGGLGCTYVYAKGARVDRRHFRPNSVKSAKFFAAAFSGDLLNLDLGEFHLNSGTEKWGHYADLVQTPGPPVSCLVIDSRLPYWSIVIPLTLLSAWLLLSRPRSQKSKTPDSPIPETAA